MSSPSSDPLHHLWIEAFDEVSRQVDLGLRPSIKDLLMPLMLQVASSPCLKATSVGFWDQGPARLWLPRFTFQRTQVVKHRFKLGIFAGIHGDEPAGILGLMDFVRELDRFPELGREYQLYLYPLCNPSGYLASTRESASGRDLNRQFWRHSPDPEVALLEQEIHRHQFDGIIALHSDDTCDGFYGFARDRLISEQMLTPALQAAGHILPCDPGPVIDGFHAVNSIIHSAYDGILSASPTQRPQPFEVILESPQHAALALQRQAFVSALRAILQSYRSFMAYGADL